MQKIMYDAFMTFKEEGCKWGSMGLSPLANLNEGDEKERAATKLLSFAYENLNSFYGFKDLYNAKQHYNPSCWIPGYFIYLPKVMTPQMAYAIIRIQNPKGIMDYVKTFFIDKKKEKEQVKNDGQKKV
ncbi:MAG: phosphatidylglycerol lysyltransferase domain-containing protein, partial [Eubacterium sp.]